MKLLAFLLISINLSSLFSDFSSEEGYRSVATYEALIATADYMSPDEKAMLWEINLVRTEPEAYIPYVENELIRVMKDSVRLSSIVSESIRKRVTYVDGKEVLEVDTVYRNYFEDRVSAIRELLIELSAAVPIPGLRPSQSLYSTAFKHAESQLETRYIDHLGPDGSWPQERIVRESPEFKDGNENIARGVGDHRDMVIQLLIDSGVPHRGHRRNILDPEWRFASCHHVRQLDESQVKWWIQEFAK